MLYILRRTFLFAPIMALIVLISSQQAWGAKPKNPLPRSVISHMDTMCTPEVYSAMNTAANFCIDASDIFAQLLALQTQLDNVIQAGFGLIPTDIGAALERALLKCMANNPLLSLLQRFLNIFNDLLPDAGLLDQLAQCVINAVTQIIGTLIKQFLGPLLNFLQCLQDVFSSFIGSLQKIVDDAKNLVKALVTFIQNVIARATKAITNCLGAAFRNLAGVLGDCINLATGLLRSFDFLSNLTGVKFSPLKLMEEMLACIRQAANALVGGPLQALQNLYAETQRLLAMIAGLSDLLKVKIPQGQLTFDLCKGSTVSQTRAKLSKLRSQCSKYRRYKTRYR